MSLNLSLRQIKSHLKFWIIFCEIPPIRCKKPWTIFITSERFWSYLKLMNVSIPSANISYIIILWLIKKFDVGVLKLLKVQKIDDGHPLLLSTPRDYFRKMYFEVLDIQYRSTVSIINFLKLLSHFKEIEKFLHFKTIDCSYLIELYKDDFDREILILHRNIMLDLGQSRIMFSLKILKTLWASCPLINTSVNWFQRWIKIASTIPVSYVHQKVLFPLWKD